MKDTTKSFIARNKLRLFIGLGFLGFFTSMINYLTFAKVWAPTFEFYGISPSIIYLLIIPGVIASAFAMGYIYDRLHLWGLETSYLNSANINPEFSENCRVNKDSNELIKKLCNQTEENNKMLKALGNSK